jgi:hypothetical protein
MGKSVSAPPTPNYSAIAQQQGAANVDAARATAKLSNPNIIGPLGSQRVTYGTVDQAGYDKAMADWKAAGGANQQPQYDEFGNVTSTGLAMPSLAQFTSDADTPTVTQTLNPMGQQTLEEQQKVSLALAQLGQKGVSTAQDVLGTPFQYKGPDIRTDLGNTGQIAQGPDLGAYGMAGANVGAQGVNTGPREGQYGYAQGGPQAGQYGYAQGNIGPQQRATGGPQAGLFGLQQGGVQGPQLQSQVDTGGPVSGGPSMGQYGYAQGGPQGGVAQGGVAGPQLQSQLDTSGDIYGGPSMGQYGFAQGGPSGPQLQQKLDTSNLAAMPVNAGMTAQNAIMSRLEPQLQRQRAQRETQLANQGLARGGEAYNAAIQEQQQGENDLRTQAALQGINLDMSARQQGLGEQQALGSFGNQAALSQFGAGQQASQAQNAAMQQNYAQAQAAAQQGNAAQQQRFNQRVQAGEFGNQAQLASFNANLQNQQAGNQAIGQNFAQGQAAQQAQNAAMQQNYAQALSAAQQGNAAQQQAFAQRVQAGEFGNQAQLQGFSANLQNQQAGNQAASNNFAQAQAAAQMRNQAAGQNYQQAMGAAGLQNQAVAQNFQQGQQANEAYNQAVQQNMAMGLTAAQAQNQASQQLYSQLMGVAGLQNQAVAQNQNAALQQQQAQNAAQAQQFNQALQGAQFGNTAAQQALQQQLGLYNQPLNQISALMSGSQVQMPQFQGYTGANVAAAPIMAGAQAQDQAAMQRYNAAQTGANSLTGGLFGLGASVLGGGAGSFGAQLGNSIFSSDRRLKSNIERVGTHPLGIGIYEYDIFDRRERGVMAQEVEQVMPSAVIEHPSGFKMVNYGLL